MSPVGRIASATPAAWRLAPRLGSERTVIYLFATGAALVAFFAYLPVDVEAQILLGGLLLVAMAMLRMLPHTPAALVLFLTAGGFLTLRYFFWRTFNTVVYNDLASFICSVALYLAELYGIFLYLVSLVINSSSLDRQPVPMLGEASGWPTVDIMVPSYNEPTELLEVTLTAALQMQYPKGRYQVHLLDDGGTVQKRNDPDPAKAREALKRHCELKALCDRLGARYHTRERNVSAKAGNINSALPATDGELILVLDADHVPTADFLEKTAGWFQRDPKLFLLQTPHFFINPDPIEKNLQTYETMPSENEMFYGVIQRGLDFWNSSFFCGSAALLRRTFLEQIGGISGVSITEDAETALELHAKGYRSAYIDRPLIAGLQPETFGGFVVQRTRWAQGMVQIFLLKNPVLRKGLSLAQRLGYFNSSFFWFFAYARVIFTLAPAFYLLFGLQIYKANFLQFVGYALPHVVGAILVSNYLFGHVRWTLFSELYETMQSFFCLRGLVQVFLSPRSPSFGVTPKGEHLERNFISPFVPTFYTMVLLMLVSLGAGVYRFQNFVQERSVIVITMAWAMFNMVILIGALGAMFERAQQRRYPRIRIDLPATLQLGDRRIDCEIEVMSVTGVGIRTDWRHAELLSQARRAVLLVPDPESGRPTGLAVEFRSRRFTTEGVVTGAEFHHREPGERQLVVRLIYGDSERWQRLFRSRQRYIGVATGIGFFLSRGLRATLHHGLHLLHAAVGAVARGSRAGWRLLAGRPIDGREPLPTRRL